MSFSGATVIVAVVSPVDQEYDSAPVTVSWVLPPYGMMVSPVTWSDGAGVIVRSKV